MRSIGICLLALLMMNNVAAQQSIHFLAFPGYLVPHRQYMLNMASPTYGAEISLHFESSGNPYIDSVANDLQWGIALYANHLGNSALSGNVVALNPYFQVLLHENNKQKLFFKFGVGLGFLTQKFDPKNNPYNRAISNRLNGAMYLHLLKERAINSSYSFIYGFGITHFSNGNYSRPNLGINIPQINLGFGFNRISKEQKSHYEVVPITNFWEVRSSWGTKQASVADLTRRSVYDLSVTYGLGQSALRSFRFGFDFFYDQMNPYRPFQPETLRGNSLGDIAEVGLRVGHEYLFGKISLHSDAGVYLYKPKESGKMPVYFCLGLNYHMKQFNFGPRLKTHLGVADFIGFGMAYRFVTPKEKA